MSESIAASPKIKLRIESLSDLVFGLALSLGSLVLISKPTQTPSDLVSGVVLFGFSFAIVVWIWSGYTRVMIYLPTEIRGTYVLNFVLLFCVAIEPYLFYVVWSAPFDLLNFASAAYALDGGAMMLILAGLVYLLLGEEKKRNTHEMHPLQQARFRGVMIAEIVAGVIFLGSALPFAWIPLNGSYATAIRFDMWYANFAIFFVIMNLRRNSR